MEFARSLPAAARRLLARRSVRRPARWASILLVAVAGAWLGVALAGPVHTRVGPAEVGLSLTPSWEGDTVLDVRPLGTLTFDSHDGPAGLGVRIEGIETDRARELINSQRAVDRLPESIEADLRHGLVRLALYAGFSALLGAGVLGLIVYRRPSRALLTSGVSLLVAGAVLGAAVLTFRPQSIVEPRYTGLLTGAPSLVGSAQSIVQRFSVYRTQLAKIVTNVSQLYEAASGLPDFAPDPSTVRVLHVSDIHLNPIAWNVIRSLVDQFKIDAIIDTGDLTDHGSSPENRFTDEIGRLGVPYVWVRGNHDSMGTQRAVARKRNAVVLDGDFAEVAGLRIYGIGDPRFTPDKSVVVASNDDLAALGRAEAERLTRVPGPPDDRGRLNRELTTDVVAVHDPTIGRAMGGAAPLVLSGHTHRRSEELLPSGTRLLIQGSTGGAGLRALEKDTPTPIQAAVLYFDKDTKRLRAWDNVTLGGLGLQSAQIERHIEPEPGRTIHPVPTPAPSPVETVPGTSTATVPATTAPGAAD
ncbi:metallophosphoesterase family protein [Bailinhaonella thermotolerans]|uniref:Calcineurin-like phosphoesterase domain-containing protein n=1 Tax=Bailinhaonella thermotolerans TaxID=1070861 RepID=A0A3A4ANB3_9ACTN|nr:metallophosphoesterase [Bailinhaonella thermotolerans]RJL29955.1 hypothetical protein D5H75_23690 [Bailinhaonella thermotolerans]